MSLLLKIPENFQPIRYIDDVISQFITEAVDKVIDDDRYNHCGFEMLIGIPGCGKSTYIKKIQIDNADIVVISPDNIRRELTSNVSDQSQNVNVWNIALEKIIQNISNGKYVILDATNVSTYYRTQLLNNIKNAVGNNVKTYATVFYSDQNISKKRISTDIANGIDRANVPYEIIDKMYIDYLDTLQTIKTEGFDKIFWQ